MTTRYTKEKIYDLLPAVYRQKDIKEGKVLESLINIVAKQVGYLEKDIEGLYNNMFIETCDEWVVPYIADLFNIKLFNSVTKEIISQRSWVANTLSYRRKKGTPSVLEKLAYDTTGWHALVVEFFQLLSTTQYLNHLRMFNLSTIDLKNAKYIDDLNTPFDKATHTLDVRNIDINRGYYNISNVGIFLWRLQAFPVISAPAFNHGDGKFSFDQLGYNISLFNRPRTITNSTPTAKDKINIPDRIQRIAFHNNPDDYYSANVEGDEKSIRIRVDGEPEAKGIDKVIVCDLSDWLHRPADSQKVAIDPVLGRILFPTEVIPKKVYVDYYYGFSGEVGGGFYARPSVNYKVIGEEETFVPESNKYSISKKGPFVTIASALNSWKNVDGKKDAILEITDSEFYDEELEFDLPSNTTLEVRSSQKQRPLIRIVSPIGIKGEKGSRLIIDGLTLVNASTSVHPFNNNILKIGPGNLQSLIINHCTLVPERSPTKTAVSQTEDIMEGNMDSLFLFSWDDILTNVVQKSKLISFFKSNFDLQWVDETVLFKKDVLKSTLLITSIDGTNSVLLTLDEDNSKMIVAVNNDVISDFLLIVTKRAREDGVIELDVYANRISIHVSNGGNDDLQIFINRSITGRIRAIKSQAKIRVLDSVIDGQKGMNVLTGFKALIENSTIFGKANIILLERASNSIFTDVIFALRRQSGCMRYCYIPPRSQTPRHYKCQPESHVGVSKSVKKDICPQFTSTIYGDPGYAQLHKNIPKEIFEGADNDSEMGAFNHLYQPQRINNLKTTLEEYLRFGLEAGIFLVT